MLASVPFTGAAQILSDEGHDRWTAAKLLTYLNQVRRTIVEKRPAEFAEFSAVQLVAGTKQTAPSNCAVLVAVTRNMGSDGATPGQSINRVHRESLDAIDRTWRNRTGTTIDEYVHEQGAKTFLVSPGVPATPAVHVELELATYLADLAQTNGSEQVGIPDKYEMAMVYWLCHMAFSEDTEASSVERAGFYYAAFAAELGVSNDQPQ